MAHRPRIQFPGAIYHVMSRGNRKSSIFNDDDDRGLFLKVVDQAVVRYGIRCYAICLMGNHYHLVFDTPRGNLSDSMRHINGVYTQNSNRRHERSGHVFEGRFRSIVVQRESYLRRVGRYVVLNPVRAGIVRDATAWQWSSYRATAGIEPPPSYLYVDWIDWAFESVSREEAQRKYRLFVNDAITKKSALDLKGPTFGNVDFEAKAREAAARSQGDRPLPRVYRALARPTLQAVFGMAWSRDERNRLIYQAHVEYGYRLAEIATYLGVHASTPSQVLRRLGADRAKT